MEEKWGKGEVRAIWPDGKVTVRFARVGDKRLGSVADLEKLEGDEAEDEVLDTRPTRKVSKTRVSTSKAPPIEKLKQDFIKRFPGGFEDPDFVEKERKYKLEAHTLLEKTLDRATVKRLLDEGKYQEVCARARAVVQMTNLVDHRETSALNSSTRDVTNAEEYAKGLNELLYGDGEFRPRFEQFVSVLGRQGGAKWPIATYFPFIAYPGEHMFLKPEATKAVALSCGVELGYRPTPNWKTYEALQRLVALLQEKLADLHPRDLIDVQSFIWYVWRKVEYAEATEAVEEGAT
jgi:hypothetical protein